MPRPSAHVCSSAGPPPAPSSVRAGPASYSALMPERLPTAWASALSLPGSSESAQAGNLFFSPSHSRSHLLTEWSNYVLGIFTSRASKTHVRLLQPTESDPRAHSSSRFTPAAGSRRAGPPCPLLSVRVVRPLLPRSPLSSRPPRAAHSNHGPARRASPSAQRPPLPCRARRRASDSRRRRRFRLVGRSANRIDHWSNQLTAC